MFFLSFLQIVPMISYLPIIFFYSYPLVPSFSTFGYHYHPSCSPCNSYLPSLSYAILFLLLPPFPCYLQVFTFLCMTPVFVTLPAGLDCLLCVLPTFYPTFFLISFTTHPLRFIFPSFLPIHLIVIFTLFLAFLVHYCNLVPPIVPTFLRTYFFLSRTILVRSVLVPMVR